MCMPSLTASSLKIPSSNSIRSATLLSKCMMKWPPFGVHSCHAFSMPFPCNGLCRGFGGSASEFACAGPKLGGVLLEMEHESGGRFRGVSGYARAESGDSEVRAVVDKSAILQSKRDMSYESVVYASAVDKCRAGLTLRSGHESSCVARRIEY